MADNIIQSFLVALGFKIDETSLKKFDTGLKEVHKTVKEFSVGFGVLAIGIEEALRRVGRNFEQLFFLSAQIGTSANNLKSMQFAFSQVGIGADAFGASLNTLNRLLLESPGMKYYIQTIAPSFSAETGKANDAFEALIKQYADILKMEAGPAKAAREAAYIGMLESMHLDAMAFRQAAMFNDKRVQWQEKASKLYKDLGLDARKSSEQAFEAMEQWHWSGEILRASFERITLTTMPALNRVLEHFSDWFIKNIIPDIDDFAKRVDDWFADPKNVEKFDHALDCVAEAATELVEDIKIVIGWFVALQKEIGTTKTLLVALFGFSIAKALAASITSNLVALAFAPLISGARAAGASAGGAFAGAFAVAIPALILGSLGFLESWISERFGVPNPAERRREEIKLSAGHKPGEEQSDYSKKTGMREGGPADRLWKWLFSSSGAGQTADKASRPDLYDGPPIGGNQSMMDNMVLGFQHWWGGSGNFRPRIDFVDGIYNKIADVLRDVFGLQPGGGSGSATEEAGGAGLSRRSAGRLGGMGPRTGGGGGQVPQGALTIGQLKQAAISAGWPEDEAAQIAAIAMAESKGNPYAHGKAGEEGVTQILPGTTGAHRFASEARGNPVRAMELALTIRRAEGWRAWSVYKDQKYKQYLEQAQRSQLETLPTTGGTGAGGTGAGGTGGGRTRGVNPALVETLEMAKQMLPAGYTANITSGLRPGDSGQHGRGQAMDIQIVGPDGKPISNRGLDTTGMYRKLAHDWYNVVSKTHPELLGSAAWGGEFGTQKGGGGPLDLMHFDFGGRRGRYRRDDWHYLDETIRKVSLNAADINQQYLKLASWTHPASRNMELQRGGPDVVWPNSNRMMSDNNSRRVAIDSAHSVTINLHGVTSPQKTAEAIEDIQRRHSLVHARNLRTVIA